VSELDIAVPAGRQEVILTRTFDAPRAKVFKAFTDPVLIPKWWGPRSLTTVIDRMEPRAGGSWRFVQHDAAGEEFAFHGVYHDVTAPARLIQTFEWEGLPGHALLETIHFEEHDGRTTITDTSVFQTIEDRDGMVANGMEYGARESMERLVELLGGEL
jgi:uncharacterized protein YndB with AHSA1/START domain